MQAAAITFAPHTKLCPTCGKSTFEYGLHPAGFYFTPTPNAFQVEVGMRCKTCGYKGVEKWVLGFERSATTYGGIIPKPIITPSVPMHKVKSSVIDEIGYNPATMHLFIKFHTGDTVYGYKRFYATRFVDFLNAGSLGRFYAQEIKGKYDRLA